MSKKLNKKNNIINFPEIKKQEHKQIIESPNYADSNFCTIIYKDIRINFGYKDNAYSCIVERGN